MQRDRFVALVLAPQPSAAVGGVGLAKIDDAELLLVGGRSAGALVATMKVRMSRRDSAPSDSKPSGISDRRVFSRLVTSSF